MEIAGITDRLKIEADRVEVRGGGGCLPIVGCLFLLMGCAPVAAMLLGSSSVDGGIFMVVMVGVVSLFCVPLGVILTFGRYAFEIDGNTRTYRKRFSILVTIKESAGSLDEFNKVVVSRRVRHRGGTQGTRTTCIEYPIRLEGAAKPLEITTPDSVENGRRDAEQVAKALRLPLADRTGPTQIVREAEHLDESLRERRQRTGKGPDALPPVPEGMKTQYRVEGDEVVLVVPPLGCTSEAIGHLISWAVVMPGLAFILFRPFRALAAGADSAKPIFIILGMALSISAGVGLLLRSLRRSDTIRVTPERLHVRAQGAVFVLRSEIPADELEELYIIEPKDDKNPIEKSRIRARSDRATIEFGHNLPPEDKEWVKSVLELILTT